MKLNISQYLVFSILLFLSFTTLANAEPNLPTSTQMSEETNEKINKIESNITAEEIDEKIEIIPEIKIESQSTSSSDPRLKMGKACSDEDLEEVKGEVFVEIPMAKTVPCDKVDCNGLKPARLLKNNYKKLKNATTLKCGE